MSLGARAWAHTAASFGPAEAWSWEPLRVIVLESRWGGAWQRQVLAAVALALAAAALARWRRAGWVVYTAGAVIVCATLPLLGHGAGSVWRTALHAGHLLGAGAWLGTLAAIVAVGLGARRAPLAGSKGRSDLLPVLQRFSNVALTGAGVAAATGALLAAVYVLSPINLTATGYGRTLLVKLAGVGGIAWCGRRNWQRARRGDTPSPGLIGAELGLAAAVVVVTSVLTELEQP